LQAHSASAGIRARSRANASLIYIEMMDEIALRRKRRSVAI
jgi:hypothetical protein